MPRSSRIPSSTGIYHIILRGINKQVIFEEDDDFSFFINLLHKVKELSDFKLYAYCLMSNHIHLLIQTNEDGESLESIFKRLESRFVLWYNRKYGRTGHLFQDRFLSEPVETALYFKAVFRYIHQNPMKAGLETAPGTSYVWSSYYYYTDWTSQSRNIADLFAGRNSLVDISFPIRIFGSMDFLLDFCSFINASDNCLEYETQLKGKESTDMDVVKMLCAVSGCRHMQEFKMLSRDSQYFYIRQLFNKGISQRQLSRVTGFSRKTLSKACNVQNFS